MTEQSKRSVAIDATRTLMNTLIVLHHSGWGWMAIAVGATEGRICSFMNRITWTLPALFCLSGYLMMRGYSPATIRHKLWSRCKRLAAPLFLVSWGMMIVIGTGIFFGWVTDPKYNIEWALRSLFCVKHGTTLATLWYVRTLLVFTILSPVFYFCLRRTVGQIAILACAAFWCLASTIFGLDNLLWKIAPSFALLSFLIGGVLAVRGQDLCAFARKWWLPICICYAVGVTLGAYKFSCLSYKNGLICTLPCLFWFMFAHKFESLMKYRWFQYMTECAFFVFVIHSDFVVYPGQLLRWIYSIVPHTYLAWPGEFICAMFFVATVNLLACMAIYAVLKRICPLAAKILNGQL